MNQEKPKIANGLRLGWLSRGERSASIAEAPERDQRIPDCLV